MLSRKRSVSEKKTSTLTSEAMLHHGVRPLVEEREENGACFREEEKAV